MDGVRRQGIRFLARARGVAVLFAALAGSIALLSLHGSDDTSMSVFSPARGGAPEDDLTVAAVQFEMSEELLVDLAAFEREIVVSIEEAADGGSDLVVFPEYVNVFPALAGSRLEPRALVETAGTVARAGSLGRLYDAVGRRAADVSVRELFTSSSEDTLRWMDRVYGSAAAEHGLHIVAGTYFARVTGSEGDRLKNRAVVYGPDGERIYEQDKRFLTPFEEEVIGLDTGDPHDAEGVQVGDWSVGLTICRDTYFPVWNAVHHGRDLWIDLRGEATAFDGSVRRRLEEAVPARLHETEVPYGVTVFLTGELYGLYWEGRSSVIFGGGAELESLDSAKSRQAGEVLVSELPPR